MKKVFLMILLMASSFCLAKEQDKRKIANTERRLQARVILGDAVTDFVVSSSNDVYHFSAKSNRGLNRQREITKNDFDFIFNEYSRLPLSPKVAIECYRSRMDIKVYGESIVESAKSSCYGMRSVTEPQYVRFSKILVNGL